MEASIGLPNLPVCLSVPALPPALLERGRSLLSERERGEEREVGEKREKERESE